MVDDNNDGVDDRILSNIPLPAGFSALGVDAYFEHGQDRLFVTAARVSGATVSDATLFIIAIDADGNGVDLNKATIVKTLPLDASYAKGVKVVNNQVLIAMAEKGLGIVDSYLHTKAYLTDSLPLPQAKKALDVEPVPQVAGHDSVYALVGGNYDFNTQKLLESEALGGGGFQLIERSAVHGLQLRGSLDMPASRVVVQGHYAYLAAGDAGLVIVDITDIDAPYIVSRVNNIGYVLMCRSIQM